METKHNERSSCTTPTIARNFLHCLCIAFVILGVGLTPAKAQDIGEAEVIRLAKSQDPGGLVARAEIALAQAGKSSVEVRDNPSLALSHEHLPGGASAEAEETLLLTLPIELARTRASRRSLADSEITSRRAEAAQVRKQAVVRSLQLFYQLVAEREGHTIRESARDKLAAAALVVTKQREAGKVSGYDQIRIEIELEIHESELRQSDQKISQMQREISLLLGVQDKSSSFVGSLDLVAPVASQSKIPSSISFLHMAASQAVQARRSANKGWLPKLELSAGPRLGLADETKFGYAVGISVELPFYSGNKAIREQARARVKLTEARAQSAQIFAKRDEARAEEIMIAARDEALKFEAATGSKIERLGRAAASRYREGQSIIELVDAERARTLVGRRRLELRLLAKKAEVSLRAARGEFE